MFCICRLQVHAISIMHEGSVCTFVRLYVRSFNSTCLYYIFASSPSNKRVDVPMCHLTQQTWSVPKNWTHQTNKPTILRVPLSDPTLLDYRDTTLQLLTRNNSFTANSSGFCPDLSTLIINWFSYCFGFVSIKNAHVQVYISTNQHRELKSFQSIRIDLEMEQR